VPWQGRQREGRADRWALSLEEHAEHLVLHHAEIEAGGGAAEVGVALLAVLDLAAALSVVGRGEARVRAGAAIAVISNTQIESPSEYRPVVGVAVDQFISPLRHVLLLLVEGEQEGPPPLVVHIACSDCVPPIVGVAGEGPPELGAHQGQRVLDAVAARVEGRRAEGVLGGAEQQRQPHRSPEALPQELQALLPVPVPFPEGIGGFGRVGEAMQNCKLVGGE
jgi:hypothetical protein